MTDAPKFTLDELYQEAVYELNMRLRVYSKNRTRNIMAAQQAQIDRMRQIGELIAWLMKHEDRFPPGAKVPWKRKEAELPLGGAPRL